MAKTVVGLFDNYNEAQTVVQELVNAGFNRDDISLAANDAAGAGRSLNSVSGTAGETAGEAAGRDAGHGAWIGGIAGLLVGLGALTIPGVGPIIAAGPIAAVLAPTAVGAGIGAAAGGLIGALTHMGVPREQAEYYNEGVRRGGTLITVSCADNMVDRAVDIMNGNGAVDIDERAGYYRQSGYSGYDESAAPYTTDQITRERDLYRTQPAVAASTQTNAVGTAQTGTMGTARNQGEEVIPVVEEELQVGKRQVQRGGARIHTVVTERPVEEQVTLREEHVTVDRRPADRPATDADMAFREGTIEVTETAEQAVVAKQAHVVEEVVVGKEATQRTETVRDTVRRTDVEVEELDNQATGMTGTTRRSDLDPMTDDEDLAAGRTTVGTTTRGMAGDVDRTLPGNRVPGVQTGGRDADGSPDTRGITEKVADAVTGDNIDDKTGKPVR